MNDWKPDPNDWFSATVTYRNFRNHNLHFDLSDGSKAICFCSNVTHSSGGHVLCIPEGTVAAVRLEPHQPKRVSYHTPNYRVIECRFLSDESIPRSREKLVIQSWSQDRAIGSGIRPCACPIFVAGSHEFREGDVVVGDIIPSIRKPGLAMAYVSPGEVL